MSMLEQQLLNALEPYHRQEMYFVVDAALPLTMQPQLTLTLSEHAKSLQTVSLIWDFLLSHHATRHALLVCVGGGVTLDIGGFAAATYKRGIDYINVPTSLLAMVDASIGGKTGCDYHGLKNVIGVIRQPLDTIIMPKWLDTLPHTELLNGYAELVKTALLDTPDFYTQTLQGLSDLTLPLLSPLITQAVAVKRRIVAQDPQETGARKALNLGHTIGHALEELSWLKEMPLSHGVAVLYGLIAELYISTQQVALDETLLDDLVHVMLPLYGRPASELNQPDNLLALMRDDKKNGSPDTVSFTLLAAIGQPCINQLVDEALLRQAIAFLFSR